MMPIYFRHAARRAHSGRRRARTRAQQRTKSASAMRMRSQARRAASAESAVCFRHVQRGVMRAADEARQRAQQRGTRELPRDTGGSVASAASNVRVMLRVRHARYVAAGAARRGAATRTRCLRAAMSAAARVGEGCRYAPDVDDIDAAPVYAPRLIFAAFSLPLIFAAAFRC